MREAQKGLLTTQRDLVENIRLIRLSDWIEEKNNRERELAQSDFQSDSRLPRLLCGCHLIGLPAACRLLRCSFARARARSPPPEPELFLFEAQPRQRRFQRSLGFLSQCRSPGHRGGNATAIINASPFVPLAAPATLRP